MHDAYSEIEAYATKRELMMNFNLLSWLAFTSSLGSGTLKYNMFAGILFAERQYSLNQTCGNIGDYNKKITQP